MDIKKIAVMLSVIVGFSAFINLLLSVIVPRYEIEDLNEEIHDEMNRIEIKMIENDIFRLAEESCNLSALTLIDYQSCMESVQHEAALRYLKRNE